MTFDEMQYGGDEVARMDAADDVAPLVTVAVRYDMPHRGEAAGNVLPVVVVDWYGRLFRHVRYFGFGPTEAAAADRLVARVQAALDAGTWGGPGGSDFWDDVTPSTEPCGCLSCYAR